MYKTNDMDGRSRLPREVRMTSGNDKSQRQWGGRITLSAAASVLALAVAAPVAAQDAHDPNTDESSVEQDVFKIVVKNRTNIFGIKEAK